MITAKEMRELAIKSKEEILASQRLELFKAIQTAAKNGRTLINLETPSRLVNELESLGYTVSNYWISW